tara:strand:- start:262 stop:501 length:240 start_codon:yes stop_codon:yes gene_type:complete
VDEVREVLSQLDFNEFKDDDFGIIRDAKRLLRNFGWHKGDFSATGSENSSLKKQTKPAAHLPTWPSGVAVQNSTSSQPT